jgi:hypothetical protein
MAVWRLVQPWAADAGKSADRELDVPEQDARAAHLSHPLLPAAKLPA